MIFHGLNVKCKFQNEIDNLRSFEVIDDFVSENDSENYLFDDIQELLLPNVIKVPEECNMPNEESEKNDLGLNRLC